MARRTRIELSIPKRGVDEIVELGLSVGVVAGDAHDVFGILPGEVLVLVEQGLAHAGGVVGVDAEDDGLLETVAALLEVVRDPLGHAPAALVDDQGPVEVLPVVTAARDQLTVGVGLAGCRAVALHIHVQVHLDDLVGGEKAVADSLLEGVAEDWLAEPVDVGDVLGLRGCGGEADPGGSGEVVEDLPPGGVLGGAAAVTLVDHDQIEETGGELAEDFPASAR